MIAVVVGVIALRSGSDDPSTDGSFTVEPYTGGVIEIKPETGSPGALIDIVGDPCPSPPEGAPYSGIVYWIDQDGSTIVSGEQDDVQTVWSDSMVMPDDAPIGAAYEIGAACYATDDNGDAANFYEFTPIAFTME